MLLLALLLAVSAMWTGCSADEAHSLNIMNAGVKFYNEGNYPNAVQRLKEANQVWPENHKANYMLGQIYLWKYDQPEQAIAYFDKATTLAPDDADYWYHRGHCQTVLKNYTDAESSLARAVELNPKHAESHYRLGILSERQGKVRDAAEHYMNSIRADPRIPYAYYNLGDLYFRNSKFEEARRVFKNGVENNANHPELHHGLGLTYITLDRKQEALVEFQEALRLKSSYPSALYNIGMTYVDLGDKARAKTYLEKFVNGAVSGENSARITAAEARLLEIKTAEMQAQ
jgi:tetratricopeptide (TPR) repeat protein